MRRLLAALVLGLTLFVPRAGAEDPPAQPGFARIKSHRISARFDPGAHMVIATDVIDFDTSGGRAVSLLDPGTILKSTLPLRSSEAGVSGATLPQGVDRLELAYAKRIDAGAAPREGVVSETQILLTGANGWYPRDAEGPPHLARFDVTTYVPEPLLVVTQGRAPERTRLLAPKGWSSETVVVPPAAKEGEATTAYAVSTALAQLPTGGLALVAGPYRVSTRTIEGLEISTYLLARNAEAAPRLLDAMDPIVARYERRLGTYPHPKFDVVESVGGPDRGTPSFVALDEASTELFVWATREARGPFPISLVELAYVRGWFGDGIFPGREDSTFCEDAARYLAELFARELASPGVAREARQAALSRARSADGALVLHAVRRRLGDAEFFARLKRLVEDRVGTYVGWADALTALDAAWARPLIDRPDLPTLRIVAASRWPGPKRSLNSDVRVEVVAEVAQGAAPWPEIDVPLAIDGEIVGDVRVADGVGVWTGNVNGLPEVAEIDPNYDVLRKIASPESTRRAIAESGRPTLDVLEALRVLARDPSEFRDPVRFLASRLEAMLGVKAEPVGGGSNADASGVADLTSSRDLTITTATGTVVLKDAFRPICASPPRAKGKPLVFGEGDNPVPLPGRIPDTSVEGLERYWRQIDLGVAPALMLLPNPTARKALASLVDAPNALTPEAEAELSAPGADGAARPRPPLGPWIAQRRAKTFPGLRPLRVPVLLITDEAYEKIFELKDILTVDFEISFAPVKAGGSIGSEPAALVAAWLPPGLPVERPPVVVVSARVGAPGEGDDASTGVAGVLGALEEWAAQPVDAKRGLVVVVRLGGAGGLEGARGAFADLAQRYDVRSVVEVEAVGRLRDDEVVLTGLDPRSEAFRLAADAFATAGLKLADGDVSLHQGAVPVLRVRATAPIAVPGEGFAPPSIDPTGVARVSAGVRELLRRFVTAP